MTDLGHNGGPPLNRDSGWVSIARSMREHPIVGFHLHAKPCDPTHGAMQPALAFIDLIMECRYEDGAVLNGGRKMVVRRGELVGAISWLANRWNWTPKAVRLWLDRLEMDGMIARFQRLSNGDEIKTEKGNRNGNQAALIKLCNYSIYQSSEIREWQSKGQSEGNRGAIEGQSRGKIYKDNKGTKEQTTITEAVADQVEEVKGLNGATAKIVSDFANWISPYAPDLKLAHKSITDACGIYGADAVRDGYAELLAKQGDGKINTVSVRSFYAFCKTAAERKKKSPSGRSNSKQVPRPDGVSFNQMTEELCEQIAKGEAI